MRVLTDPASTPAAPGAEALERRGLGRRATWAALPLALGLLCATPWCGARPLPASERQVERTAPAVARTGRFAIAPRFEGAESFAEGLAAVRLGGKWGFVDKHGRMVIPPRFNPDQPEYRAGFSGGLAPVNFTAGGMGAKWGFIDATGAMAIEPQFQADGDNPPQFHEGLALIRVGSKYGYIDNHGDMVIAPVFDRASAFSDGLAAVNADGKEGYINARGLWAIPPAFDTARPFSEGLAVVTVGGKDGLIDATGHMVVAPRYDWLSNAMGGLVRFADKGFEHLGDNDEGDGDEGDGDGHNEISDSGAAMRPVAARAAAMPRAAFGFMDHNGHVVIPARFDASFTNLLGGNFSQGLAPIEFSETPKGGGTLKRFGYIDTQGRIAIPPRFDAADAFSEGLAAVRQGHKFGYIDHQGHWIIPPRFDEAAAFHDGLAKVRVGERYGFIYR